MALVVNSGWCGQVLSPTGKIEHFAVRFFIWSVQAFLILMAVLWGWVGATRRGKMQCLVLTVACVFCFFFLLFGIQVVGNLTQKEPITAMSRVLLPQFSDEPWAEEYWVEFSRKGRRFRPYYLWRSRKQKGKYINVDSHGVRKTWNPDTKNKSLNIWFLGGSTTWGSGARDDYTIPSQVSRMLDEAGIKAKVTNFGDTGYVFSQEIIYLMEALRLRDAPDLVIFYDGANDVYTPYQSGYPGVFMNYRRFLDATNLIRRRERYSFLQNMYVSLTDALERHFHLYRIVNALPERLRDKEHRNLVEADFPETFEDISFQEAGAQKTKEELDELAKRSVTVYRSYADLLKGLSKGYDFDYVLLWQPLSFYEDNLFDAERVDDRMEDPALQYFAHQLRSRLGRENMDGFYDISDALKERSEPTYFDFCHLTEQGNRILSEKIIDLLIKGGYLSEIPLREANTVE